MGLRARIQNGSMVVGRLEENPSIADEPQYCGRTPLIALDKTIKKKNDGNSPPSRGLPACERPVLK
jgi:hypothetical protein